MYLNIAKTYNMEASIRILETDSNNLSYQDKHNAFELIKNHLSQFADLHHNNVEDLFTIIKREISKDPRHSGIVLEILCSLLPQIKNYKHGRLTHLTDIAGAILHLMITTIKFKAVKLQGPCVNVLSLYPDSALTMVMKIHSDKILDILMNLPSLADAEKSLVLQLVTRCLSVLPENERNIFVENSLPTWFGVVVPLMFSDCDPLKLHALEVIENLIPILSECNRSDIKDFVALIRDKEIYPAQMVSMLKNGNSSWDRVWTCITKLLSKNINHSSKTINNLLSVLESAFKIEAQKHKGYKCWKTLIDMFDRKELQTVNRIKLLALPFTHINAKTEDVIKIKFEVWFHLLSLLKPIIDSHSELLLLPFLHFCFGVTPGKPSLYNFIAASTRPSMHMVLIKSLVTIFGHSKCSGCKTELVEWEPYISLEIFNQYSDDWNHCVKNCFSLIVNTLKNGNRHVLKEASCLFSSYLDFLKTDNLRHAVLIMENISKEHSNIYVFDLLVQVFITIAFDKDAGFPASFMVDKTVFNGRSTVDVIKNVLILSKVDKMDKLRGVIGLHNKFKVLIKYIIEQEDVQNTLSLLESDAYGTYFYSAFSASMSLEGVNLNELSDCLHWPANKSYPRELIDNVMESWSTLYSIQHNHDGLDKVLITFILSNVGSCNISIYLLETILAKRLDSTPDVTIINDDICLLDRTLHQLIQFGIYEVRVIKIAKYILQYVKTAKSIKATDPLSKLSLQLIKTFFHMVVNITGCNVQELLSCILDEVLCMITGNFEIVFDCIKLYESAKSSVFGESLLKHFESLILNKHINAADRFKFNNFLESSSKINCKEKFSNAVARKKPIDVSLMRPPMPVKKNDTLAEVNNHSSSDLVVIPSKWKFNPSKLTDKQRENFKRRRDDIPALYQDTSQSRDDSSLHSWQPDDYRTDSQEVSYDIHSTSKKAETILKEIPNSDVCPNIIYTLLTSISPNANKAMIAELPRSGNKNKRSLSSNIENISAREKQATFKQDEPAITDSYLNMNKVCPKESNVNSSTTDNFVLSPNPADDLELIQIKTNEINNTVDTNIAMKQSILSMENERPTRVKKKPKKFDPDDHTITKNRRSSDVNIDYSAKVLSKVHPVEHSNNVLHSVECSIVIKKSEQTNDDQSNSVKPVSTNVTDCTKTNICDRKIDKNQKFLNVNEMDSEVSKNLTSSNDTNLQPEVVVTDIPHVLNASLDNDLISNTDKKKHVNGVPFNKNINVKTNADKVLSKCKKKSRLESQLAIDMIEGHPLEKIKNRRPRLNRFAGGNESNSDKRRGRPTSVIISLKRGQSQTRRNSIDNSQISKKLKKGKNKVSICNSSDRQDVCNITMSKDDKSKLGNDPIPSISNNRSASLGCETDSNRKDVSLEIDEMKADAKCHHGTSEREENAVAVIEKRDSCFSEDVIESSQESSSSAGSIIHSRLIGCKVICDLNRHNELKIFENRKESPPATAAQHGNAAENDLTVDLYLNGETECVKIKSALLNTANNETENKPATLESQCVAEMDTLVINSQDINNFFEKNSTLMNTIEVDEETSSMDDATTELTNFSQTDKDNCDLNVTAIRSATVNDTNFNTDLQAPIKAENDEKNNDSTRDISIMSSPQKDDTEKRNYELLNSTLDMSPIVVYSKKSAAVTAKEADETDFNKSMPTATGETSPDVFSIEKAALNDEKPNTCNDSPPRNLFIETITSPSISAGYKKNRPNAKQTGRGAHMLGLCVPDKANTLQIAIDRCSEDKNTEAIVNKTKGGHFGTTPTRNFKIIYKAAGDMNEVHHTANNIATANDESACDASNDSPSSEVPLNVLTFAKLLPDANANPSPSILKRKREETLTEDASSPACKKKRVSFHDPPVSVTKYIEYPHSPQQISLRLNKEGGLKSPKLKMKVRKLESYFNGITPLSDDVDDTTPVSTSFVDKIPSQALFEDNLTNVAAPVCPDLVECIDPVANITDRLASSLWENCLREELRGKVITVGDFASLTASEVGKLSIKSPKVETARNVLEAYCRSRRTQSTSETTETAPLEAEMDKVKHGLLEEPVPVSSPVKAEIDEGPIDDGQSASENVRSGADESTHIQSFLDNHSLNEIINIYFKRKNEMTSDLSPGNHCKIFKSLNFGQMYEMSGRDGEFLRTMIKVGQLNSSEYISTVIEEYSVNSLLKSLSDKDILNYIMQNNSTGHFLSMLGRAFLDKYEDK